ncbi:thiolase domain-containing protein [Silicimonas algicola]|uniref:Acetyl-CoA C-acetyltransferase n=1 Tax=Silicimonas algicola TaxID=1826607 RepID=A0A316G0X4_9RHOB|nr:thiolase domain-containing protein [Silicimonas algicola]AZQ68292.1 thiolase domain-containing protein [Silicimonas algicola]PWK54571.1 acetyl-CoA C-acetyltransferase [Silicimonas algicola]
MTIRHAACIVGAFEHPTRHAPDKSHAQLHAEVAAGAIADAGLSRDDIDGYFCSGDAPGGLQSMLNYLNLTVRHVDATDIGGVSPVVQVAHAAAAIALGRCSVALITLAGRPRADRIRTGTEPRIRHAAAPDVQWEYPYAIPTAASYALAARRHMHEFGTTSEQLAWIKVAASHHAQHNQHAVLRDLVTVEDVVNSPLVADPLHRLDCCVISDGGGAVVVARPDIARSLARPVVRVLGAGESTGHQHGGRIDLTRTAAVRTGPVAFAEAGVTPADIRYASLYDSFTITVLLQLEDLGFCGKGKGGAFVSDGALISGVGRLAVNTDGGGLCNNHPANRGGITKIIEAVRQLRGEAHPAVQVPDCALALVHGTGGQLATRHGAGTLILERAA